MTEIFDLLERKLGWLDARQRVLAQNIANADTPDYKAKDVAPFAALINQFDIAPARTNALHLAGLVHSVSSQRGPAAERAPDGNAVVLEDQLTKVAEDENAQALTGNLWKSYMGLYMTALGHG